MAKRIPFKYGRRRCIFCTRQPPEVTISKEHLFGDWLREIFPRTGETTHTLGVLEWASSPGRSIPKETRKGGQGHSGSKKIRDVCTTCNGTWLSNDIEEAAKPILFPLMNSESVTVDSVMQRILATWAAKTVMTAEYVHPSKVVIHQAERTWLKNNLAPPVGWNVWVGTYQGLTWSELAIQQHAGKLRIPTVDNGNPAEHNLVFTILGMRRLMFVVVSSTWPRMWEIIASLGDPNPRCLSQIWPIVEQSISWPRLSLLTDADVEQLPVYLARAAQQPV